MEFVKWTRRKESNVVGVGASSGFPFGGATVAGGHTVVPMDSLIHLSPVDRHLFGRLDPQTHFVAADFNDDNRDVVVDYDTLVLLTG
jgi:hypothetical protein